MDLPEHTSPPTDELLDQYLAGRASPEEAEVVRTFLATPHSSVENVLKRGSVVYLDPASRPPIEPHILWQNVSLRIANASARAGGEVRGAKVPSANQASRSIMARVTAGVLIVGAIVAMLLPLPSIKAVLFDESGKTDEVLHRVTMREGQHGKWRLPDGSVVVLAPGSQLEYKTGLSDGIRDIALTGEALFTIVSDEQAPFIVRAGPATVRVLGTTFVVRHYPNEASAQVVVAQGKVSVTGRVLANGDAAVVHETGATTVSHNADISSKLAWTTGTLVFNRTPLRDVLVELERWYDVRIVVIDTAMLNEPLTMTFLTNAPDETFAALAALLRARVLYDRDQIILAPEQRPRSSGHTP